MSDGRRFDELTRIWAKPMSRRRALRLSAGVVFGAVAADVLSSAPVAADACGGTCSGGSICCPNGTCIDPTISICCGSGSCTPVNSICCGGGCLDPGISRCCGGTGCLASDSCCGSACCSSGQTCLGGTICCDSGQVCGSTCCPTSTVCLNASTGACGCPSGGQTCGNFCCKKGETCADPTGGCCCPKGATPCGTTCCASGVACLDPANGICGCQKGTTPFGSGANLRCCPAGTAGSSSCPPPSGNTVKGVCSAAFSDRNIKEHVVPVTWERN